MGANHNRSLTTNSIKFFQKIGLVPLWKVLISFFCNKVLFCHLLGKGKKQGKNLKQRKKEKNMGKVHFILLFVSRSYTLYIYIIHIIIQLQFIHTFRPVRMGMGSASKKCVEPAQVQRNQGYRICYINEMKSKSNLIYIYTYNVSHNNNIIIGGVFLYCFCIFKRFH